MNGTAEHHQCEASIRKGEERDREEREKLKQTTQILWSMIFLWSLHRKVKHTEEIAEEMCECRE